MKSSAFPLQSRPVVQSDEPNKLNSKAMPPKGLMMKQNPEVLCACCCSGGLHVVAMALWTVLPLSLPVFTITGIWLVYVSYTIEAVLHAEPPVP